MKRQLPLTIIVLVALMGTGIAGTVVYLDSRAEASSLPVIEKAPEFNLIDQDSREISLGGFTDKVKVLSFFYVRCNRPAMCPRTTKYFRRLQKLLKAELADKAVLFLITLDPAYDKPGVLKKYGELYGAEFTNWHFLTGEEEAVNKALKDYVIIREKEEGINIRHSVITFLIDQDNNIRKMYIANQWQPEDVFQDIVELLKTDKNRKSLHETDFP